MVSATNSGKTKQEKKKKRKTPLKGLKTVPGNRSREQNIKLSGILQRTGDSTATLWQHN